MHHNKRGVEVRLRWVMLVGANDMRRTGCPVSRYDSTWISSTLYHRLAASCTSVELDLHNLKASVRAGRDSDTTLRIKRPRIDDQKYHIPGLIYLRGLCKLTATS